MTGTAISAGAEQVVLERGPLRIEVELRPFAFTIRRNGRRVIRNASVWVADGKTNDHFVQMTEGVIPREELAPHERAQRATVEQRNGDGVVFALRLEGGRHAELGLSIGEDTIGLRLTASGSPARLAIEWDRRSGERYTGLGARHTPQFDQAGRMVQLGADRRYTGPDCPPDMLAAGGIPQGDCAPTPWLLSSRGMGRG